MIINMSGGGGGKVFAVIGATYPAGSTCTCSNGSKTLKAKDTSGQALFTIPEAGTWTVTAVSGDKSASKAVEITAEGQVENVKLVYILELYDNGEQYSSITGGWSLKTNGSSVGRSKFNADHVVIDSNYPDSVVLTTNNKIDLSEMHTLTFLAQGFVLDGFSSFIGGYLGVSDIQTPFSDGWGSMAETWTAQVALTPNDDYTEYNLDVSTLTGSYYVCAVGVSAGSYKSSGVRVKSITAR